MLLFQFFSDILQFGIPCFAKFSYQWFFQELVNRYIFFLSQ